MATDDFRADQIQTNKVIATGSTGTGARILVYPIDAQDTSSPNQGQIDPNKFNTSEIGTDTFLFVSGAVGSKGVAGSHGTTVFGGDVHISGNLSIDGTEFDGVEIQLTGSQVVPSASLINFLGGVDISSTGPNSVDVTILGGGSDPDWNLAGSTLYTTASVSIGAARSVAADEFFFVSGTLDPTSSNDKFAVFGGAVRVSGALVVGTGSLVLDDNKIHAQDAELKFSDINNAVPITLTQLSASIVSASTPSPWTESILPGDVIYTTSSLAIGQIGEGTISSASLVISPGNDYKSYVDIAVVGSTSLEPQFRFNDYALVTKHGLQGHSPTLRQLTTRPFYTGGPLQTNTVIFSGSTPLSAGINQVNVFIDDAADGLIIKFPPSGSVYEGDEISLLNFSTGSNPVVFDGQGSIIYDPFHFSASYSQTYYSASLPRAYYTFKYTSGSIVGGIPSWVPVASHKDSDDILEYSDTIYSGAFTATIGKMHRMAGNFGSAWATLPPDKPKDGDVIGFIDVSEYFNPNALTIFVNNEKIAVPGQTAYENLSLPIKGRKSHTVLKFDARSNVWRVIGGEIYAIFDDNNNAVITTNNLGNPVPVVLGTSGVLGKKGSTADPTSLTDGDLAYIIDIEGRDTATDGGQQNNYTPGGSSDWWLAQISPSSTLTITGLSNTGYSTGDFHFRRYIKNTSEANSIILKHQNGSSSGDNQIQTPDGADYVIEPGKSVSLVYAGRKWVVLGDRKWEVTGSTVYANDVAIGTNLPNSTVGDDVHFFVYGTTTSGSISDKIATFGGSVRISGTLSVGSGSTHLEEDALRFDHDGVSIRRVGDDLTFSDINNSSGLTLTQLYGIGQTQTQTLVSGGQIYSASFNEYIYVAVAGNNPSGSTERTATIVLPNENLGNIGDTIQIRQAKTDGMAQHGPNHGPPNDPDAAFRSRLTLIDWRNTTLSVSHDSYGEEINGFSLMVPGESLTLAITDTSEGLSFFNGTGVTRAWTPKASSTTTPELHKFSHRVNSLTGSVFNDGYGIARIFEYGLPPDLAKDTFTIKFDVTAVSRSYGPGGPPHYGYFSGKAFFHSSSVVGVSLDKIVFDNYDNTSFSKSVDISFAINGDYASMYVTSANHATTMWHGNFEVADFNQFSMDTFPEV